jgi:hypothetical protein
MVGPAQASRRAALLIQAEEGRSEAPASPIRVAWPKWNSNLWLVSSTVREPTRASRLLPSPMSQAAVRSRLQPMERPLKSNPRFYYALFAFNAVLVVGFWWLSSGSNPVRSQGDLLNALGRVTGLLGTYGVLWQLTLMSRAS